MKKLTFSILATVFMLSVIPTQLKASTGSNLSETTENSTNISSGANTGRLNEIKPIEASLLNSTEKNEALKVASPVKSEQDEHGRRFRNRHQHAESDLVITSGHNDGYNNEGHRHSGAYIGIGGVLVVVLIMVLIL
jgi:hypothetical protein